jgi:hypothetical protein
MRYFVILDNQSGHYTAAIEYMARGIMDETTSDQSGRYLLCPMLRLPPAFNAVIGMMKPYSDGGAYIANRKFDTQNSTDAATLAAYLFAANPQNEFTTSQERTAYWQATIL